jgi:hypothetical protein
MMRGDHDEACLAAEHGLYAHDPEVAAAAHALCVALNVGFSYSVVYQTGERRQTLTRHIAVLEVIRRRENATIEDIVRETGMDERTVAVALDLLMRGGSVESGEGPHDGVRYRLAAEAD